jgi:Flp pilus assembly protein TadD
MVSQLGKIVYGAGPIKAQRLATLAVFLTEYHPRPRKRTIALPGKKRPDSDCVLVRHAARQKALIHRAGSLVHKPVRGEVEMAISKFTCKSLPFRVRIRGALLLASAALVPAVHAQTDLFNSRNTISGSVFVENMNQPAARVRVDVRGLSGGGIATAYTDSSGHFQADGTSARSYIVSIDEPGYEPVEERIDSIGASSGVVLTLKKAKTLQPEPSSDRYTVSIHALSAPGKARKAFEKGIERLQKNDPAGSIAHFKEATDVFPDYYEAFYQLGMANLELRRGDEAERALQKAIDLSGGHNADPQFAMSALLCDRGQFEDAERVTRRALEIDPVSWRGYLFLGQALYGQNHLEEAEKNTRMAITRKQDLASAYVLLANIDIRRQDYRKAIADLDIFLRLKPDDPVSQQARDVRDAAQRVVNRFDQIYSLPQFLY